MLSANQQKMATSLHVKKYRQKYQKFIVEGEKMADELLSQRRIEVLELYATSDWLTKRQKRLQQFKGIANAVTEQELNKISALTTAQSVLLIARIPEPPAQPHVEGLCFYLDGIQDPGNVGAIWRIADWFGMPALYCSPDCADPYAPKTVQASMGSLLRVPVVAANLDELLANNPSLPVWGADLDGDDFFSVNDWPLKGLIVIGSEGRGLRPEAERLLSRRLRIPRHPQGGAESLNAAVAAGILAAGMYQSQRNHHQNL